MNNTINITGTNKVDTSLLIEGAVIKNYKGLCGLLGCPVCTGNGKIAQIKNWSRYFAFEKQGHKFIIKKIYDTPLPFQDARNCRDGIYVKYIESLLLRYLLSQENGHIEIIKRNLYCILGMITYRFFDLRCKNRYSDIIEDMESDVLIDKNSLVNFKIRAESKISQILSTALKSMQRRGLIIYSSDDVVVRKNPNGYGNEATKASNVESDIFRDIRQEVLNEMEYSIVPKIIWDDKLDEFNGRVISSIQKQFPDIDGVFTQLSITVTGQGARLQSDIDSLPYVTQRRQLNCLIIDALDTQAVNYYNKRSDGWSIGSVINNTKVHFDENYVVGQKEISKYMLDISDGDEYNKIWKDFDLYDNPDNQSDSKVNK